MGKLKQGFESGDPGVHLQVHNIWPMLVSAVLIIVSYVSLQKDAARTREDFIDYKSDVRRELESIRTDVGKAQTTADGAVSRVSVVESKMPAVRGVSTSPAVLRVPTRTVTPTVTK